MLTNCVPGSQAPSTSDFLAKRSKLACLTRKISKTIELNPKWLRNLLTNFLCSFRIRKDSTGHMGTLNIERPIAHQSSITFFLRHPVHVYMSHDLLVCIDATDRRAWPW